MVCRNRTIYRIAAAAMVSLTAHAASAAVITQYAFTAASPTPSPTESATTGTGTATALGMTNAYTYANGEGPGSVDGSNITTVTGLAGFSEATYKIVGNSNKANSGAGKANGWNNAAPNYTQGLQFTSDTTGFQPTQLSFDWFSTTQGVGNLQVRYSLDGNTWINLGADLVATSGDFYGSATGTPSNTLSLVGLPADATNDPKFAIQLVSVRPVVGDSNYSPTGPGGDGNYASAAGGGADYNNSSGNWSFNNLTVSGAAVPTPEPATAALLGLSGVALLKRRRTASVVVL